MSGATATLWRLLNESPPLFVVLYGNPAALEDVVDTVLLLAPPAWHPERSADVGEAFHKLAVPLLLTPLDEPGAVLDLDGRRDALLERTAPAILFLLKDGEGERALREAPGLASWIQGRVYDPDPDPIDVDRERERFTEVVGQAPNEWLQAWRRGAIPDTLENSFFYQRALLLEES